MPDGKEIEAYNPWDRFRWGDYGYQHWREPYYEQGLGGWQPRPRAVARPPATLSYYEFLQLDLEEQDRILRDATGGELPNMEGTGYIFNWGFKPETGRAWQLEEIPEEEKEPWQAPAFPTTKRAGGYTFVPDYDAEGNITGWRNIGRTPEEAVGPEKPGVVREGLSGEQLRSLSLEFELWKSQVLQDPSIAGSAGWIRRYMIEQIQNPFAYEKQRQAHRAKAPPDVFTEAGTYKGPTTFVAPSHVETPGTEAVARYERKKQTAWSRRGPARPKRPTLPVAPKTLAEFVPGLVAGQTITKEPVTTPSGQQWMATPWSQREQLRGYTEWSGGRPYQDILDQMRMMLPEAPTGAFRKRWSTTKQWA